MKNKLFAIITICILILTSLTAISTTSNNVDQININTEIGHTITNENNITDFWAILVAPIDYTQDYFVRSANYLKDLLILYGWKEDHIVCLFDEDANETNLINAFNYVSENDKPSDTTLIFLADHGSKDYFYLTEWGIWYEELDVEIDKLDSKKIGVIVSACYSGSAIPHLQDEGRVIVTSCGANETGFAIFSRQLVTGLLGFADKEQGVGDNNDIVSLEEAYFYYLSQDDFGDREPQIQDNLTGSLDLIFLNNSHEKIDQFPQRTMESNASSQIGKIFDFSYQATQAFIPSYEMLTKVRLNLDTKLLFTGTEPLNVSIRKNLSGEDLTSISIPYETINQSSDYMSTIYKIIDFPDIEVTPGDTYYIVCKTHPDSELIYSWRGRGDNCYDRGMCYISEDYGETWVEKANCADLLFVTYGYNLEKNPPSVNITKPENALYITNIRIRKFLIRNPLIIGKINITVNATDDESGIERVEFYIDGELKTNITTPPYTYEWKREGRMRIFGHRHTIKVIAYDNAGNNASKEIKVWKFL